MFFFSYIPLLFVCLVLFVWVFGFFQEDFSLGARPRIAAVGPMLTV
jgi:hypothetical protein